MDRNMILSLLAIAVFGFLGILLLLPEGGNDGIARLPWEVSTNAQGRLRVFGFTLGETTLGEVRKVLGEEGTINLFAHPGTDNGYAVEAFFDQIYLSRLRASFVIALEADQHTLEAMYERGLRISQLGSGAKKVQLAPADVAALVQAPIRGITYLPWSSLDADTVANRFGKPAQTLTEEAGVTHWLYPEKGMDIGRDSAGGIVIQYIDPRAFADLMRPLLDFDL